jgi:hypothetical protein
MNFRFVSPFFLVITLLGSAVAFSSLQIPFGFFRTPPPPPFTEKLAFTTSGQTVGAGDCSGVTTVQSQTLASAPFVVGSNLTVNLTPSTGLSYYSDSLCMNPITTVTILSGASSADFYFISDVSGVKATAATAASYSGGSQNQTINANAFMWTGGGGDANWTTGANWSGGAAPSTTSHTAYFVKTCASNCSPTIDTNISIKGIKINSGYTGTITQPTTRTITLAGDGWLQKAGTFAGGDSAITINGSTFSVLGGTFTSTTNTFLISNSIVTANSTIFTVSGAGSFIPNSGTVKFNGMANWSYKLLLTIDVPDFFEFNHVILHQGAAISSNSVAYQPVSGRTIVVRGNLTHGTSQYAAGSGMSGINGLWNLEGNLTVGSDAIGGTTQTTGVITLTGTGAQTITGDTNGYTTDLAINKASGAVTVGSANLRVRRFLLDQGTFTAPTGTLESYLYRPIGSTTSTVFRVAAGTTFNTNSGTVKIRGDAAWLTHPIIELDVPDLFTFNNLVLGQSLTRNSNDLTFRPISSRTIITNGNFSHGGSDFAAAGAATKVDGTWQVKGNYTIGTDSVGGAAAVTLNGTGAQTITVGTGATMPTANFVIDKASGTATMTTAASFNTASQTVSVSAGILDMAGFNLTVNSTMTVAAGAKLLCNGGVLSAGSYNMLGEVSCGPSAGISWTGAAGDNLWNTAGNWTSNTIPGASDVAVFNGSCVGANCNAQINLNISVLGIDAKSTYTGTLTQNPTRTMMIGASGWTHAGGTFAGGDSAITLNGNFALSGGTFTATSGTLTQSLNGTWSYAVTGSPTFNHNSGTIVFNSTTTATRNFTAGTASYYNFTFAGNSMTTVTTDTLTVLGTLTLGGLGYLNGGTIEAKGNVTASSLGQRGSTLVKISGTTNQTVNGTATTNYFPNLEIASTGGTVTLAGTIMFWGSNFTYTSGTLDAGTSTIKFNSAGTASSTFTPGATPYYNVYFGGYNYTTTLVGTLTVNGLLTVGDSYPSGGTMNSGTILAKGDVTFVSYGKYGSTLIKIAGSGNQTLTGTASGSVPAFEIASTGGTVSMVSTFLFRNSFTHTSGVVDAGTSTVYFGSTQTITPGTMAFYNVTLAGYVTTITLSGTMTVNGLLTLAGTSGSPPAYSNGGTIVANGDVTVGSYGIYGTTKIKIGGSGNQTLNSTAGGMPELEIASTGGTVSISGVVLVNGNYTYTSGTVDWGTSTLQINSSGFTVTPGAIAHGNVTLKGYTGTTTISGTWNINGTLTYASTSCSPATQLNTGAIVASGDVVYSGCGMVGNSALTLAGSTSTNLNFTPTTAQKPNSTITVAKTGGTSVVMTSNASYGNTGQNLTISSGTLDLGGYALTVTNILTISSGATLRCNGGTYTAGSLSNSGTLNCPGDAAYEFNWTGTTTDGNWNTAGNWQGGAVPGATGIPYFDSTFCGANCNVTMNATVNVRGVQMTSGYSGTITQGSGIGITIGTDGWTQVAGNFIGSNTGMTLDGPFAQSGGSFTAPAATITAKSNWSITGASSFTHNGGTVAITNVSSETKQVVPGTVTYGTVQILGGGSASSINFNAGTMTVSGPLTFNTSAASGITNGTISVAGDVTMTSVNSNNSLIVKIAGSGNQTVTGTAGAYFGTLQIASTGGTVTMAGTITVGRGLTYTSGTIDWGTSLLSLSVPSSTTLSVTPSGITYGNVEFAGGGSISGYTLNGGTMNIGGTLTFNNTGNYGISNGTIAATGDVAIVANGSGNNGDGLLKIAGSSNQSVTVTGSPILPGLEFASTGGTVTVSGNLATYRSYTYTSGTVSWGSSSLNLYATSAKPIQIYPGALVYGNVGLLGSGTGGGHYLNSGTMNVGGTLTINSTGTLGLNNGTIDASGDFIMNAVVAGNAAINFTGSSAQTITQTGGTWPTGTRTVNKTGGSITQTTAVSITGANPLAITTGSWLMSGYALTVPGLSLNSNTLTKGGGILTVNSVVAGTGSLYGGTVAP